MKIGYRLIKSPFKYHLSYPNDGLNYKTPSHKPISIYGNVVRAMSKTSCKIKPTVPTNDDDFVLKVATVFNNTIAKNAQYIFTNKTLIVNYQNHVLNNANYSTYWEYALNNN